jgi:glyoxylase-like metal-dependent hydrolase (beta-lactamase superfamily II)
MVDPARLINSARRLYGDAMDALWGEFAPVPAGNVVALTGGERIAPAGRVLDVAYTPGHASHHVCFFDGLSGVACVGDTGGGRIADHPFVAAPTPPPDIDLSAWHASLDTILAWQPETLFLTHFGASSNPPAHVASLRASLDWAARAVQEVLRQHPDPAEDTAAAGIFEREMRLELRRHLSEADAHSYELAVPPDHCYLGLARYWRTVQPTSLC